MTRALLALVAGALILPMASTHVGAQAPPPLSFFTNYFVTGDYAVAGASLWRKGVNGRATATLELGNAVPAGVDIVAAFLYVQTAEAVRWSGIHHATFNTVDLGSGADNGTKTIAKALNWEQNTRPCWSVAFPGGRRLVTYRADVLRFLPLVQEGPAKDREFDLSRPIEVSVPDWGNAFGDDDELGIENPAITGPRAVGASLVVVYRDPNEPYRGVVLYDGGHTKQAFATMVQTLAGFYQAAASPGARLTAIVGDGRPYLSERLRVNGHTVATNPFTSSDGPKWDNRTFNLSSTVVAENAAHATIELAPNGLLSDCVSTSAVVMSVAVKDGDGDGLLDVWETAGAAGLDGTAPLVDPNGQPLPLFGAMGADKRVADLFIEVGALYTTGSTSYGGVSKPQHSHLPGPAALKLMGDAFDAAPTGQIRVHFDMGPGYAATHDPQNVAAPYLIPAAYARGGELIDERVTVCAPGANVWECQFSQYPGTVGWKTGFRFLRDQVLQVTPLAGSPLPPAGADPEDFCGVPGYSCTRRFDPNRQQSFHYALFAHAVGLPESDKPCLSGPAGTPQDDLEGVCTSGVKNPAFNVPRTNTGIGDFPGGDVLVTLGAFNDSSAVPLPIGTPFMQASTLMHELGHNMERRHGGEPFEQNCKPTYFSVMNYLYQLRGLLDNGGGQHLDFAHGNPLGATVNEAALPTLASLPYRLGWYAPMLASNLKDLYLGGGAKRPTRYCNGAEFPVGGLSDAQLHVRVDAPTKEATVDWAADGDGNPASPVVVSQDVNFNGRIDGAIAPLAGSDDWSALLLNQVAVRRNVGAIYTVPGSLLDVVGPLSVNLGKGDLGKGDLGKGDLGKGDLGKGDLGKGDLGKGDLGKGDLGKGDLGKGDLGKGDLGGGDLFDGGPDNPGGELDFETFVSMGSDPPYELALCVSGPDTACPPVPPTLQVHDVLLSWSPAGGNVVSYTAFRAVGAAIPDESLWTPVGTTPNATTHQLIDAGPLVNGQTYTYFVIVNYLVAGQPVRSAPSNPVTVTAVNDAPTISDIADRTISAGTGTGAIAFVVGDPDDTAASLTVSGGSSNTTLVPAANIVFGGSGANRIVAVTPAPNKTGTATITVTVTDPGGRSASDSFLLTVDAAGYGLVNVKNLPPAAGVTFKPSAKGTLVDFEWKFTRNGGLVASSDARPRVTIQFPNGSVQTFTPENCAPAGILFEYKAGTKVWDFHWVPKNNPAGTYYVIVYSDKTEQRFPASGAGFPVVFKK